MLTAETYDKYVVNAKKGDKPWLVMIMRTPYGSNENSYQVGEMMLSRMACASKALNFNLGLVDVAASEDVVESFHLRVWGGNGLAVPYYIYTKDGTAYHLQ